MSTPRPDQHEEGLPLSALAGMLLAASLAPLGSTMIAVALPSIGHDIGAETSTLTQWLVSSYLITSIALQSPGGKLGDLIGHARGIVVGLSLVAMGGVLGLLVNQVHALGVARILMASGGAATVPATLAILRNQTAPDRRARVFGLFGACMGLAAAVGPLVGGELTERFGWRAVFAANLPVIAVSLLLVLMSRGTYTRPAADPPSFDWAGSALLASGLTLTIVSLQMSGAAVWWLGGSGAVLLIVFPFWERRAASPVVDFSLLERRAFFGGGSIIALQNMAMYPLLFQLPIFFDRVRHLGARAMGQALLALTMAMVLSSVAGGRLTELMGARAQTLVGSLIALAGLWWFTDLAAVQVPFDVVPGMLLIGAGVGMTSPPAQAASMSAVGRDQSGMAGGVISTLRYIGGVAGTTALGALLRDSSSPASHQRPLFVYAGALVVAAALSMMLPGRRKQA
ncbi:MAG: MFS transporter [Luteitalea sp.]|nr:MFS transporter [Luteitalea sp.]